jgi:hypothetical protein
MEVGAPRLAGAVGMAPLPEAVGVVVVVVPGGDDAMALVGVVGVLGVVGVVVFGGDNVVGASAAATGVRVGATAVPLTSTKV